LPNATGTVITTGNLSDITDIGVFTSTIVMEGSTANAFELTLSAGDPTADRTITFPDATGTVALAEDVATSLGTVLETSDLSDTVAELNVSGNLLVPGASIIIEGETDNTFETTLTVTDPTADRTITFPDANGTVALAENVAALSGATFTGAVSGTDLTLSGNLTVNGTTTNINSTNLVVEDKNIVLADVTSPTDTTADGGGITLKGATDKTLNWVDATDAWTSSEDFNLLTGKVYEIAGTPVLSASTLGAGVTASSLTSVGTITSGTWNGTTIAVANGGTGITSFGTGVATFLGTPSSANFASMITDEIGTGNVLLSDMATSAQSASYTLVLADKAKVVEMSVGSANNLTVPLNATVAFPVGTQIHMVQTGAGQTTVVATGGVTINSATTLKIRAQWGAATLIKRAENTWVLVGDLATS
jgi:hypothetical protein